MRMDPGKET